MRAPQAGPLVTWLCAAFVAAAAIGVYANALDNPFVYDDRDTVVANPSLQDPGNVRFVLVHSPFRPLVNVSYALDRALWGTAPFGYHLTSVLLHALAAVLVFFVMRKTLEDGGGTAPSHRDPAACAASAAFAVHPMMSEAVGYISGRSEVLCAVWFTAGLLMGRRAMVTGSRLDGSAALLCGTLAAASKEVGATLAVVLLAYDWLLRPGDDERRGRRLRTVFFPIFAVLGVAAAYRLSAPGAVQPGVGSGSMLLDGLTQATVVWRYLALLAWPAGQSVMHGVRLVTSAADPVAWAAVAALAVVAAVALRSARTRPVLALGILWFLIVLAPSSSIIPLREPMAEHRVYLASVGLFLILAWCVSRLLASLEAARPSGAVRVLIPAAVVLVVLGALTVRRNEVWGNPAALWMEATVHGAGSWEPHYALADTLRESGDCAAAVPEYRRVIAFRPAHRDAHTNLGICLGQSGDLAGAEAAFRRALEIDPSFARGYTNLGAVALMAGDAASARDFYRAAIEIDNRNVLARMQLASLYEHTFGDHHAAARMCGEARLLAPDTPGVADCVARNQKRAADKDAGR